MTNTITIVEAREHFSELINRTAYGKERIVLKRRGKDIVAVVPLEDLKLLEQLELKHDLRDARKALREAKLKGSITLEQFRDELK